MIGGYCIVCVMGPREIFGPRAPQSLNPALLHVRHVRSVRAL